MFWKSFCTSVYGEKVQSGLVEIRFIKKFKILESEMSLKQLYEQSLLSISYFVVSVP